MQPARGACTGVGMPSLSVQHAARCALLVNKGTIPDLCHQHLTQRYACYKPEYIYHTLCTLLSKSHRFNQCKGTRKHVTPPRLSTTRLRSLPSRPHDCSGGGVRCPAFPHDYTSPCHFPCDPFHLLDTTHLTHEERRHGSPWDIESNGPFAVVKSKNYRNAPAFPAHGTSSASDLQRGKRGRI